MLPLPAKTCWQTSRIRVTKERASHGQMGKTLDRLIDRGTNICMSMLSTSKATFLLLPHSRHLIIADHSYSKLALPKHPVSSIIHPISVTSPSRRHPITARIHTSGTPDCPFCTNALVVYSILLGRALGGVQSIVIYKAYVGVHRPLTLLQCTASM